MEIESRDTLAAGMGRKQTLAAHAWRPAVNRSRVIRLLSENAKVLKEDVALMSGGRFRVQAFGVDVTAEQVARLESNLERIETILTECGCNDL